MTAFLPFLMSTPGRFALVALSVLLPVTAGAAPTPFADAIARELSRETVPGVVASVPASGATTPAHYRIVRPYQPPQHRYGPGHRGVDIAWSATTPVTAFRTGTVCFAGEVAQTSAVSICHHDGTRTTYTPVTPFVSVGAIVNRGDEIGTVLPGHLPDSTEIVLHFGWKDATDYRDPTPLIETPSAARLLGRHRGG